MSDGAEKASTPGVVRRTGRLAWWTVQAFFRHSVPRLGAALAFYATIAVAPLLVLTIALAGVVFQEQEARSRVLGEIERLAGKQAAEVLREIETPDEQAGNVVATSIGLLTLAVGGFSLFWHLQEALNQIWSVKPRAGTGGWRTRVMRRLFSFGLVVATGFILLVSLIISAGLNWLAQTRVFQSGAFRELSGPINTVLSLAVTTFLFAMIFRVLPDRSIRWRDVWTGAFATAVLFTLGKYALAVYLSRASQASYYGVAASAITLLLWTYYAAQIVLLGAEFTRIHATSDGGRKPPEPLKDETEPSAAPGHG